MSYNDMGKSHMMIVTGDNAGAGVGLTAWRNADLKFAAAECIPVDIPLEWSFKPPEYNTVRIGPMTTSRVSNRYSTGVTPGMWKSRHAFQTVQFGFWIIQTPGVPTAENTPAGYNTHALTIGGSSGPTSIPLWHGIHFERESIASNELRYDMMGLMPQERVIEVGTDPELWKAVQEITVPYAYLQPVCDDISAQIQRAAGTVGSIWKTWEHAVTGNLAGTTPSGITYGGAQLEVDVTRIKIVTNRSTKFNVPDTSGFHTVGHMGAFDYSIELDVIPTGNLLYEVNRTKKESYTSGEVAFSGSFTADSSADKISVSAASMFMIPFDEINDYNKWIEGYTITLEPFGTGSSYSETGIDILDNTHFENP